MKNINILKIVSIFVLVLFAAILVVAYFAYHINIIIAVVGYTLVVALVVILSILINKNIKENNSEEEVVNKEEVKEEPNEQIKPLDEVKVIEETKSLEEKIKELKEELNKTEEKPINKKPIEKNAEESNIGTINYDKDYVIESITGFVLDNGYEMIGEKLLSYLPETQDIIDGTKEKCVVKIKDKKYEATKKDNSNILVLKDISREYDLEQKIKENAYVLGLCNFDNYNENEEPEEITTFVNANIKLPVMEYFKKYGIVYRTLRNNRLQLILNYQIYKELFRDRFSIINVVRNESKKAGLNITLSMSFAYGCEDLSELDNEASNLLDIAQNRGGDQIVVRQYGKEVNYFGGTSEAKEKQSTVKVRVMTNTIKKLIQESSNVIIIGHKDADSDCIGSMLGMSSIVKSFNVKPYVVLLSGEIEPMMNDVVIKYKDDLAKDFNLISEEEALTYLDEKSLVIMCDHHSIEQSNCQTLLKEAKRVMIIDHHRRKADLDVEAVLIYVEAGASSTCEMVSEFFLYIPKFEISELVANIMYLGIVIDSDHFRVRTDTRTFDAVKLLKNHGADPVVVENMSQEPYDSLKKKIRIINGANKYSENIIISCLDKGTFSRTTASKACDEIIKAREIEAAFVICYSENNEAIITARSKGNINVQAVLEKMNGGGHMTAAGLQRKDTDVEYLKNELIKELDRYLATKETK